MGHVNLDLYYKYWADNSEFGNAAHRVLVYMAHKSMDDALPPLYYNGWENLAIAGGLTKGSAATKTIQNNTQRVLRELKAAGVIVASGQARAGVRENYALALHPEVTYEPEGTGRNVTWKPVKRPAEIRDRLARSRGDFAKEQHPQIEGAKESQNEGAVHSQIEGAKDSQFERVRTLNTRVPIKDLSNSIETSIEITSKANRPSGRTAPRSNSRSKANAEENERNRQTAALRALMDAEQKAKTS